MKVLTIIFCICISSPSIACMFLKNGSEYKSKDELISKSKSIVLAKLESSETKEGRVFNKLKVLEVLKGSGISEVIFISSKRKHYNNNFNGHSDGEFWIDGTGRSQWPCCICGPDHTFIKGENYLLFPDSFGAIKSAEIIKAKSDEWYKYVKGRI